MPETATSFVPTVEERPLMVARETFGPLAMSDTTGYELIRKGKFPLKVRRLGGRWVVNTRDLRAYLGLDDTSVAAIAKGEALAHDVLAQDRAPP